MMARWRSRHTPAPRRSSTSWRTSARAITTIGREPDNLLQLEFGTVSRYHGRLECVPEECSITDLGSSNGTSINKVKIVPKTPVILKHLDRIGVGPHFEMIFSQVEKVEEEPPPPVIPVADSTLLANFCDGILMVVRSNVTPSDLARRARAEFQDKLLLGVVLNGAPAGKQSNYYYGETVAKV